MNKQIYDVILSFINVFFLSFLIASFRSIEERMLFFWLQGTVASTHTAACVGFVRWALAAVGVDALFIPINLSSKVRKKIYLEHFSPINMIAMPGKSEKMFLDLRAFLQKCQNEVTTYAENPTQFTRQRKLPFLTLVSFQFTLLKKVYSQN